MRITGVLCLSAALLSHISTVSSGQGHGNAYWQRYGRLHEPIELVDGPTEPGHPVVLVPGDGGTQLWANLTGKPSVPHYLCYSHTSDYFDLWLNLELFGPIWIDCFIDNVKLYYNATTRTTHNTDGVDIKLLDWGNTSTVEWLDPSQISTGHYFATIVQNAVSWGYVRGKSIRGAPYDFRKAPNELTDVYANLTRLIESTYYGNGNKKVVVIAHSMGNPVMLYYFNTRSQSWKDKFIQSHVSLAGPWGGSQKVMLLYASGYNFDHYRFILSPIACRGMQRTMTSSTYLVPSPRYWNDSEHLVRTPTKNYTVADYEQFFHDIGYDVGWEMFKDTAHLNWDLPAPGVEVHCVYGTDVPTPDVWVYGSGQFPDTQPSAVYGRGDGTVNLRSLQGCRRWRGAQGQPVKEKVINGTGGEHLQMLKDATVVKYIQDVLYGRV